MRRRSVNSRHLAGALLFILGSVAIFTGVLMPLEIFIVDALNTVLLGYTDVIAPGSETSHQSNSETIRVIAKRSDEFQLVFTIDRPFSEGTKIIKDGTLIGVVSMQGNSSSKVESITSPFFRINGVFAETGIPAEFEGKGSTLLETKVPRGSQISKGEAVLESDQENLLVGHVVDIVDVPADPFFTIIVQNPINLTMLKEVNVL